MDGFPAHTIALVSWAALAAAATQPPKAMTAITGVTIIDGTGAPPSQDMTVLIRAGRIHAIGKTPSIRVPPGSKIVSAPGQYLIPGLWDMHVHWYDQRYLPLFLANGVVGARIMWGYPAHYVWRRQADLSAGMVPRLHLASWLMDGPEAFWPDSTIVSTEAQARRSVRIAKDSGADFVKVYTYLSREAYFWIVDEARKQQIRFAGHVPLAVSAVEASAAGQHSIEHLSGVLLACSTREDQLRHEFLSAATGKEAYALATARRPLLLETYDMGKAKRLFASFANLKPGTVPR